MKTSNILLIGIGGLLLSSIFINALALKVKVKNGDYELVKNERNLGSNLQALPIEEGPIDSVIIYGKRYATIHITQSDTFSVKMNESNLYNIAREQNNLIIQADTSVLTNDHEGVLTGGKDHTVIHIALPKLIGIHSENPSEPMHIRISGFEPDKLAINAVHQGSVTLQGINTQETLLNFGDALTVRCDSTNNFGNLHITAADRAFIGIDGAKIRSMTNKINTGAKVELKGIN